MEKDANRRNETFADWEIDQAELLVHKLWSTNRALHSLYEERDLVQKVLVHWWRVRDQQDDRASPRTFQSRVITNRLLEILRKQDTDLRRINHKAEPFSTPVGEDGQTVGDQAEQKVAKNSTDFPSSEVVDCAPVTTGPQSGVFG